MANSLMNRKRMTYIYRQHDDQNNSPRTSVTLNNTRTRDLLETLIGAGATGCTFHNNPAPRWAAHIHKLRMLGFKIRTDLEPHGGDYPGQHARYTLISVVTRSQVEMKCLRPRKTARWVASGHPRGPFLPNRIVAVVSGKKTGGKSDG